MAIPQIKNYALENISMLVGNKVEWKLDKNRSVLLIHDMQNYFVDFYQRDREPIQTLLKNIALLKACCKKIGIPIVYTAQPCDQLPEDRGLLTDFWGEGLKGDPELESIVNELKPAKEDLQYTKWRYSAFQKTALKDDLRKQGRDRMALT